MFSNNSDKTFHYYLLAIVGSLSSAGATMTLIALSASLYAVDKGGTASSSIYVLNYFGIGLIGFAGGWILQRFTAITLEYIGSRYYRRRYSCSRLVFFGLPFRN